MNYFHYTQTLPWPVAYEHICLGMFPDYHILLLRD